MRTDRDLEIDDLRLEFSDHTEAVHQAQIGARDLLAEMVDLGIDAFSWSIDILDEGRSPVARVPLGFSEICDQGQEIEVVRTRVGWLH